MAGITRVVAAALPAGLSVDEQLLRARALLALGRDAEAAKSWKRYLDSGAHPRFQPRARDNLHALTQRAKRH